MSEDFDLFRSEMGDDVQPLKRDEKVRLKQPRDQSPGLAARRRSAVAQSTDTEPKGLSVEHIAPVEPTAILGYLRPGVQQGVYKKLRLGKYQIEARLDLHRMTVEQARESVLQFVADCMKHDIRCALITHGKGIGRAQPAVLKSCVAAWLPQLEEVLAMHSAQPQHGGSGATYLLLRKSDAKRQANWERHIGRRG